MNKEDHIKVEIVLVIMRIITIIMLEVEDHFIIKKG